MLYSQFWGTNIQTGWGYKKIINMYIGISNRERDQHNINIACPDLQQVG
jgi:hypothetical protein